MRNIKESSNYSGGHIKGHPGYLRLSDSALDDDSTRERKVWALGNNKCGEYSLLWLDPAMCSKSVPYFRVSGVSGFRYVSYFDCLLYVHDSGVAHARWAN